MKAPERVTILTPITLHQGGTGINRVKTSLQIEGS